MLSGKAEYAHAQIHARMSAEEFSAGYQDAHAKSEGAAYHVDALVVGAGPSGISAGYHLQKNCPGKTFAIPEGRGAIGGTWDLFHYPGVRSDSDMYTLGFSIYPWRSEKAISDADSILAYLRRMLRSSASSGISALATAPRGLRGRPTQRDGRLTQQLARRARPSLLICTES